MALVAVLGCGLLFLLVLGGSAAVWYYLTQVAPPGPGPVASSSPGDLPTTSGGPDTPGPGDQGTSLESLAGTWELIPGDPHYDDDEPEENRVTFHMEGGILVAREPGDGNTHIELQSLEGSRLEGRLVDGKDSQPLEGTLQPDGETLVLTVGGESVTIRRAVPGAPSKGPVSSGPAEAEPGLVVFQDSGDVDGDGQEETVQIVALDGTADPVAEANREMRILGPDGRVEFRTDTFREPFHPDLDDLVDEPENKAGIHVVYTDEEYPDVRIIFAPASGNAAFFRYDGSTYEMVWGGN